MKNVFKNALETITKTVDGLADINLEVSASPPDWIEITNKEAQRRFVIKFIFEKTFMRACISTSYYWSNGHQNNMPCNVTPVAFNKMQFAFAKNILPELQKNDHANRYFFMQYNNDEHIAKFCNVLAKALVAYKQPAIVHDALLQALQNANYTALVNEEEISVLCNKSNNIVATINCDFDRSTTWSCKNSYENFMSDWETYTYYCAMRLLQDVTIKINVLKSKRSIARQFKFSNAKTSKAVNEIVTAIAA